MLLNMKFMYSEKASEIRFVVYLVKNKSSRRFVHIFVAFSEKVNFKGLQPIVVLELKNTGAEKMYFSCFVSTKKAE